MKRFCTFIIISLFPFFLFAEEPTALTDTIQAAIQEQEDAAPSPTSVAIVEQIVGKDNIQEIEGITSTLSFQVFGISLLDLLFALITIILTLLFRRLIVRTVFKALKKRFDRSERKSYKAILLALEKPALLFILFFGIFLASRILPLEPHTDQLISQIYQGISMLIMSWGLVRFSDAGLDILGKKLERKSKGTSGFFPLIKRSVHIFVIVVGGLLVIDNLGYDVAGIIATLGIGGAAVALASKDTVANFFGSLCIIVDRPFKVGDWIEVDGKLNGDVKSIGLRSTQIKTFMATTLSIPNSVLANETINNWSRMPKRRVKQVIGVSYETDPDTMHTIVNDIRELLRNHPDVHKDFILVNFTDFGESSLDILVYYFTKTTVWLDFLDVRQDINVKIMKIIRDNNSSIAFPSRTLYFGQDTHLNLQDSTQAIQ